MKCAHVRKEMSAYLDGELDAAVQERLAMHLEACEMCRTSYAGLERLHSAFAKTERYEAPHTLPWRVAAAIRSGEAPRRSFFPAAMKLAAQTAALTAVVAIGVASGSVLTAGFASGRAANPADLLSLDIFAAAPADSPGGVYLALMEADHE